MPGQELTKKNFAECLPDIKQKINRSVFIAIDLEFTGLAIDSQGKSSLFDTAEERYKRNRRSIQQFTVAQFGLTAYQSVGTNRYEADVYNFYLFPECVAGIDTRFSMQASSIQFLTHYHFNFNKMLYEGIPFLNRHQKEGVEHYYKSNAVRQEQLDGPQKDILRRHTALIARWSVQARDGDIYTVEKSSEHGEIPNEILHEKLVHTMDNVWPKLSGEDVLIVEKVSAESRKELMSTYCTSTTDKEKVIADKLGFTAVIDHLISSQKALVGHNVYLDLMFVYDKFINPLPESYREYKKSLHSCFPTIYDTKHMAHQLRKPLEGTMHEYEGTSLSALYTHMNDKDRCSGLLYAPTVSVSNSSDTDIQTSDCTEGQIHEAGYDSYMCGYVFLRLAHLLTLHKLDAALASHPIPYYDYEPHLQTYKNNVNLIRAAVHYICMDGQDPEVYRPGQLYVTTRKSNSQLNVDEVSLLLSSYGSVDINVIAPNKAIVAVSNFTSYKRILGAFRSHDRLFVTNYKPLRHSPVVRHAFWAGLALTAVGICTFALIRNVRKR